MTIVRELFINLMKVLTSNSKYIPHYFFCSRSNLGQGNVELESIQNPVYEDQGEIFRKVKATGSGSGPPPLPPLRTEKLSGYQRQPHSVHVKENRYEIPHEIYENPHEIYENPQEIYENQQASYDANLPPTMPPGYVFDSNDK